MAEAHPWSEVDNALIIEMHARGELLHGEHGAAFRRLTLDRARLCTPQAHAWRIA